jgi:hypothetical protein
MVAWLNRALLFFFLLLLCLFLPAGLEATSLTREERAQRMLERAERRKLVRLRKIEALRTRVEARRERRLSQLVQGRPSPYRRGHRVTQEAKEAEESREAEEPTLENQPVTALDLEQRILPRLFEEEVRSRLLLAGEESPPVAGITVFSEDEPVTLLEVEIEMASEVTSLAYLNVYLADGTLLGKAVFERRPGHDDVFYQLDVPRADQPTLPQAEESRLVVTAVLTESDQGVQGGEFLRVRDIEIVTLGAWSGNTSARSSSSILQPQHQVSLALLEDIQSVGPLEGVLQRGSGRALGSFRFAVRSADERADVSLEQLTFSVAKTSTVSLSSLSIGSDGTSLTHHCSASGDQIFCVSIPAEIAGLDVPRILTLYANIAVADGAQNPSLFVSLNDPGAPSTVGDVRWTDGIYSYTWLEEDGPIAEGTTYK